jgi:hypothetical protein
MLLDFLKIAQQQAVLLVEITEAHLEHLQDVRLERIHLEALLLGHLQTARQAQQVLAVK